MASLKRRIDPCDHRTEAIAEPRSDRCQDCGSGVNLRVCAECGYVGCCESQRGHNRQHALGEGHPIILSLPLRPESFTWCYACKRYV